MNLIFAEEVQRDDYVNALVHAHLNYPDIMWGVVLPDADVGRRYMHVLKHDVYFTYTRGDDGAIELAGVFKPHWPGHRGAIAAVLDTLRTVARGADVTCDCFTSALRAYLDAGFHVTREFRFDEALAPARWRPEYGRPGVHFLSTKL